MNSADQRWTAHRVFYRALNSLGSSLSIAYSFIKSSGVGLGRFLHICETHYNCRECPCIFHNFFCKVGHFRFYFPFKRFSPRASEAAQSRRPTIRGSIQSIWAVGPRREASNQPRVCERFNVVFSREGIAAPSSWTIFVADDLCS